MVLAIAACGGLRSAHDCRPRRALLHHSHTWAPPIRRRRFRVTRPTTEVYLFNMAPLKRTHKADLNIPGEILGRSQLLDGTVRLAYGALCRYSVRIGSSS